jgi:cell division septation protein DedD
MTEHATPARTEPELDSTTRADQSDELATTTLLRAAIGPVNNGYYLPVFTRFDAQDRVAPSWNTAAALATLSWMMFRRMWNAALAYTGIALSVALLVFGIGKLAFHYTTEMQWALAGLYGLLLVIVPGLFGNALLFKHLRSDMAIALAANHSIAQAAAMLAARAPGRQRLRVLAAVNALVIAAVAALVLWASDFNGLSTTLGLPTAPQPPAAAVSNGNVTAGGAIQASSAPAAEPAPAASAAALAASAPPAPPMAVSASMPVAAASAPLAAASMPSPAASAPVAAVNTPAQSKPGAVASVPVAAASAASTHPAAKPVAEKEASKATPAKAEKEPALVTVKKGEASRQSPQSRAQDSTTKPQAAKAASAKVKPTPAVAQPSAETSPKLAVPAGNFGINVGVFADDNNARNAFVRLSDAGFPAYTQELQGKKGKLTRVRVGPFESLGEAERTAEKVRSLGLEALVFKQGDGR